MKRGFTLIELLVAMTVFMLLGMSLAYLLRGTIEAWRMGHFRQLAEERIAAVQRQLQEDLSELIVRQGEAADGPVGRFDYDLAGRIISRKMGEALGQPIVVENRPGATRACPTCPRWAKPLPGSCSPIPGTR